MSDQPMSERMHFRYMCRPRADAWQDYIAPDAEISPKMSRLALNGVKQFLNSRESQANLNAADKRVIMDMCGDLLGKCRTFDSLQKTLHAFYSEDEQQFRNFIGKYWEGFTELGEKQRDILANALAIWQRETRRCLAGQIDLSAGR